MIWYRLDDRSFINSHDIQSVKNRLNAPQTEINSNGVLLRLQCRSLTPGTVRLMEKSQIRFSFMEAPTGFMDWEG